MTHLTRAWLLPSPDGVGVWKAENNGSAEMVGAVEYVPVSEVARLREALADAVGALDGAGEELSDFANILSRDPWQANQAYESAVQARAALKGDTP